MRFIRLTYNDIELFDCPFNDTSYQFYMSHREPFRQMLKEQGKDFWIRFLLSFRSFHSHYGFIALMSAKTNKNFNEAMDWFFIRLHEMFIDGTLGDAKQLFDDITVAIEKRSLLRNITSKSCVKDPFYSPETRDAFRRLFGSPTERVSYVRVVIVFPVYEMFAGALIGCLRRWIDTYEMNDSTDTSYWIAAPPAPAVQSSSAPSPRKKKSVPRKDVIGPVGQPLIRSDMVSLLIKEKSEGTVTGPMFVNGWPTNRDPRFVDPTNPLYDPAASRDTDWRQDIDFDAFRRFVEFSAKKARHFAGTAAASGGSSDGMAAGAEKGGRVTKGPPAPPVAGRGKQSGMVETESGGSSGNTIRIVDGLGTLGASAGVSSALKDVSSENPSSSCRQTKSSAETCSKSSGVNETIQKNLNEAVQAASQQVNHGAANPGDVQVELRCHVLSKSGEKLASSSVVFSGPPEQMGRFGQNAVPVKPAPSQVGEVVENGGSRGAKDLSGGAGAKAPRGKKNKKKKAGKAAPTTVNGKSDSTSPENKQPADTKVTPDDADQIEHAVKAEAEETLKSENKTTDSIPPATTDPIPAAKNPANGSGDATMPRVCAGCSKHESTPHEFKKCRKCKEIAAKDAKYYCSRECQVSDWTARHCQQHRMTAVASAGLATKQE